MPLMPQYMNFSVFSSVGGWFKDTPVLGSVLKLDKPGH